MKKNDKNNVDFGKRLRLKLLLLSVLIAIIFVFIAIRLFYLCVFFGEEYNRIILENRFSGYESEKVLKRGDILDRNGNVLATSELIYNLILDPRIIHSEVDGRYFEETVDAICSFFGTEKDALVDTLNDRRDRAYVKYIVDIDKNEKEAFEKYITEKNLELEAEEKKQRINGIWFENDYKRYYINDNLASNVIGFLNNEKKGLMGLELYYDEKLSSGENYNLVTTLDLNIQKIVEKNLKEWIEGEIGSKSASCIVLNPKNFEVLAMASTNYFDLNNPRHLASVSEIEISENGIETYWYQNWYNKCIQDTYEPGSTTKVFTVAAGLEEGIIDEDIMFDCKGSIKLMDGKNSWTIKCNNIYGHGKLNLSESISKSCNMSMSYIADMIGIEKYTKYQDIFGFGSLTGIDLPFEADTTNLVYNKNNMGRTTLSTNAFGQNFNVTMIQLISAYASIVNGGSLYTPHIMKCFTNEEGHIVEEYENKLIRTTTSKTVSNFIKSALYKTVENGTGSMAKIKNYAIGGKTGTAEKLPREAKKYLISFIGFDNAVDPDLLCYVVIDEPNNMDENTINAQSATLLFRNIMKEILK